MEILAAYDLTGSYGDAAVLAGCSQHTRHPTPLPSIPARSPRHTTVYQCGSCETRYLGEQYCGDCGTFCQRVGAGGLCPTCEEPVAITDLLPEGAHPA